MILVVGATGVLGGMVARRLLERGERVGVFVREGSDHAALTEAGAEIAYGDLKQPETLAPALEGVDTVVSTATGSSRGEPDTIEAVDGRGTASLIDAARDVGVARFVFVSANGFETDSPLELARAKAENEARLRESGMPYTILRPGAFMESWIAFVLGAQLEHGPRVAVVADADRPFGFVSVADVADLAVAVVGDEGAANATIPFAGEVASYRQVVAEIEKATGQEIEIVPAASGEQLPGLPPIIGEIWSFLDRTEPPAIDEALLERYGLEPKTVAEFVQATFGLREDR